MGGIATKLVYNRSHAEQPTVTDEELQSFDCNLEQLKTLKDYRAKLPLPENDAEDYDIYSLLRVCKICSKSSFLVLFILIIQVVTYILSIYEEGKFFTPKKELKPDPILGSPRGADDLVLVSQCLAISIISLVKEDLWGALVYCLYRLKQQLVTRHYRWVVANILRIFEGIFAVVVIYIHIIRSDNVVYLMKDFTAMAFISDLDNVAFIIADMKFLGASIEADAKKVRRRNFFTSEERSPKICKYLNMRVLVLGSTILTLYFIWGFFIVMPILNNDFICQQIYIQFKDDVTPKLSYFSGNYTLQKKFRDVTYYEDTKTNRSPMILRYCGDVKRWIVTFQDSPNRHNECDGFTYARSMKVLDEETFDVFTVPTNQWDFQFDDGDYIRSSLIMQCNDENNKKNIMPKSVYCDKIEAEDGLETVPNEKSVSRKLSSTYEVLKNSTGYAVNVYDRPVFINQRDSSFDIIFYLGRRWAITSSEFLYDYKKGIEETLSGPSINEARDALSTYLEHEFHGNWSDYSIDSFSEEVIAYTPNDRAAPTQLKWFEVTKAKTNNRTADLLRKIPFEYICSYCNNEFNPCYHDNKCRENSTCECADGSSGSLCQILPVKNGFCNEKFNSWDYNFDGGDCCESTCQSRTGIGYNCGYDMTGDFFIGFELCKDFENSVKSLSFENSIWISSPGSEIKQTSIENVAISSSGDLVLMYFKDPNYVQVYDLIGRDLVKRGPSITYHTQPIDFNFGIEIQVASPVNLIRNKQHFLPATVLVRGEYNLYSSEWNEETKLWDTSLINVTALSGQSKIKSIHLRGDGNIFSVNYENSGPLIFSRRSLIRAWTHRPLPSQGSGTPSVDSFKHVSICEDGKILFANNNCFALYAFNDNIGYVFLKSSCVDNEIMSIRISATCTSFIVLARYHDNDGLMFAYLVVQDEFILIEKKARGMHSNAILKSVVDVNRSLEVLIQNVDEKFLFRKFLFRNGNWETNYTLSFEDSSKFQFSSDITKAVRVIRSSAPGNTYGIAHKIIFYGRVFNCEGGKLGYFFTFHLDDAQQDFSWEIAEYGNHLEYRNETKVGNIYDTTGTVISDRMCISTTTVSCIGITIDSTSMNGVKAGVAVNGTVKIFEITPDRTEYFIPIVENATCTR